MFLCLSKNEISKDVDGQGEKCIGYTPRNPFFLNYVRMDEQLPKSEGFYRG